MKSFLLLAALSLFPISPLFSESESPPRCPAANAPATELQRLQQQYERRRAEALRPITAWYRAELGALQQRLSDESRQTQADVAQALALARETYWQEDQPELREALLAHRWLWRSDEDANGVATTFQPDGTVEHSGMRGTWRVTGPCEVTILPDGREPFILRFNASLSAYEGDHRSVSRHRLPSPR